MSAHLIVWGTGGHAVSVCETIVACGGSVDFFISEHSKRTEFLGARVLPELPNYESSSPRMIVIAIGDNWIREQVALKIECLYPDATFPVFIHPSASVAASARLGRGSIVLQGAVIGAGASVGDFCLVNTRATLDHESCMQDFSSLAPGVTAGGRVRIGARTAISIGAVLRHGVEIADDVVIGAGSYVHRSVGPNCVAYGTPASVRRPRSVGEPYLG